MKMVIALTTVILVSLSIGFYYFGFSDGRKQISTDQRKLQIAHEELKTKYNKILDAIDEFE